MSLVVASAGTVEAHLGEHLDVEGGRHRDLRGRDPVDALDGPAHLEQRHRVGVRAPAELDVVVMRPPSPSPESASRAPSTSPRPGGVPAEPLAPPSTGPVPASQAANSGTTSPCIAQSSSVAESSVVVPPATAPAASTSGVGRPARAVHRQPAAQHVVAVRREPVAATHERRDVDRARECRSSPAWARDTSTIRPMTSGSPSRCSTPPTHRTRRPRRAAGPGSCGGRRAPPSRGCRPPRRSGRPPRRTPHQVRGAGRAPVRHQRPAGGPPRVAARSPGSRDRR